MTPSARTFALLLLLVGCADPGPIEDSVAPPDEVTHAEGTEEATAPPRAAPTELTADELEALGSVEDAVAAYRGPRIAVTSNAPHIEVGVPFVLTADLTDADGASIPVDESMVFTWRLPEGWEVTGEGASITVTPGSMPTSEGAIDVGVAVDRQGARFVRGGVMLTR